MKFVLIFQICSLLTSQCLPQYSDRVMFDTWSDCVVGGAQKIIEVVNQEKDVVDEQQVIIKYWCVSENNSNKTST